MGEAKWGEMLKSGKLRIKKDGTAYSASGYNKDANDLNNKLDNVKRGLDVIKDPNITKVFMDNYTHNVKLLEEKGIVSATDYNNRLRMKPSELIDQTMLWVEGAKEKKEPITMAGLCHYLKVGRDQLSRWLSSKGYDGARVAVHNVLLKYAEDYLFTGKNINGAVFYLKNCFPELYQDKASSDVNVKISLVGLSKRADSLEYKLQQKNLIDGDKLKAYDPSAPRKGRDRVEKRIEVLDDDDDKGEI